MTMPVMEPDLDATILENWARAIDEGQLIPTSSDIEQLRRAADVAGQRW
jgi:hypothetical protein